MWHFIKHFMTITRHRHKVMYHCLRCGILWQGMRHDLSKYSPTEFLPGARFYLGDRSPTEGERREYGYSKAWMHHKGRNKHHFEYWTDYNPKTRRMEAVAGFTAMFLEMWNVNDEHIEDCGEYIQASKKYSVSTDGFVIPFGDTPLDEVYVGKRAYINNLNNASEYTYIMTPYLVIDDEMYECMKYAAQRGVDVKIIMPHIPDKKYAFYLARTYYKELLKAGIEIYEYTPGFVHAKMSISDGKKAIVGTVNHDYRSLYLHYECAAYMLNVPAVMDIERDFKDTLELSQKITLEDVKHFNIFTKLLGHIIRLVAPLL